MRIHPSIFVSLFLAILPCGRSAPNLPVAEYERAAQTGDAEAEFQLGRAYLRGQGVDKDPEKALDWMKKAASHGHADGLGAMGYFYAMGVVVPKDDAAAAEWFRKGAEKGSAKAQLNFGLALAKGKGVEANPSEGLKWIDKAVEQELPEAIYAAGETYYWGQFGRAVDYGMALPMFERAALKGNIDAQNNLGVMFQQGLGTARDINKAIIWFRKAAERGSAKGQSNLGHAIGVETKDPEKRREALKWLILATDKKEITAVNTIDELTPALPAEELAEARKAANEFVPSACE